MRKFNKLPESSAIPGDGFHRRLVNNVSFTSDNGIRYTITRGYVSDGGSIPRLFWSILPKYGVLEAAYLLHDILYDTGYMPRYEADIMLKEALADLPTKPWKRKVIFNAVWRTNRCLERFGLSKPYSQDRINHGRAHLVRVAVRTNHILPTED